jgi:hypothetical protein
MVQPRKEKCEAAALGLQLAISRREQTDGWGRWKPQRGADHHSGRQSERRRDMRGAERTN